MDVSIKMHFQLIFQCESKTIAVKGLFKSTPIKGNTRESHLYPHITGTQNACFLY